MKKVGLLFSVLLFAVITYLIPNDVYAVGTTITIKTQVQDWKNNNSTRHICGTNTANVVPTVYVGTSLSNLQPQASCNFNLSSLGFTDGASFYIVESYDFSSYVGTNPEYQTITLTPGHIVDPNVDYDDDDYMFGDYDTEDKDIVLYNMNETDDEGNIIGGLYVYDAYYNDEGTKSSEVDLGTVKVPSYCVSIHFNAKGNIADTYGEFNLTALAHDDFAITGSHNEVLNICDIEGEPLTKTQFDALIDTDASYVGVDRYDEYVIDVSNDEPTIDGSGVNNVDIYVTATLESDGSQTGLLYTVLPFVLLIAMVTIGYIVIKRNNVKDDENII